MKDLNDMTKMVDGIKLTVDVQDAINQSVEDIKSKFMISNDFYRYGHNIT